MNAPIPYPLDYQRTLQRIIDIRLKELRAAGRTAEARAMEKVLLQLPGPDFGACAACGTLIPFIRLAADPGVTRCAVCEGARAMAKGDTQCSGTF